MPLTFEEVSQIVSILDQSSCSELVVETDDIRLVVRRQGAAGPAGVTSEVPRPPTQEKAAAATPDRREPRVASAQAEPSRPPAAGVEIVAPMVGTFYVAPEPNAPPFVAVGDTVAAGDPVGLIEVMKLFTTIHAEVAGRVTEILAENGQLVEHGQPLFVIEPS